MKTTPELLQRALEREKGAREQAEVLLENRSRELYHAQEQLMAQLSSARERADEMEFLFSASQLVQTPLPIPELIQKSIDLICKMSGWNIGHYYWLVGQKLTSSNIFNSGVNLQYQSFVKVSAESVFEKGVGLPGRVLESNGAVWVSNVQTDNNFPRAKVAAAVGIVGGFAVPIRRSQQVVGVMEFFATQRQEKDEWLLKLVMSAAINISSIIERNVAEEQTRNHLKKLQAALDELKKAQQQLVQSEKMASIGMLAAGVAHEINNPVAYVMSNLGTLTRYTETIKMLFEHCGKIEKAAESGNANLIFTEVATLRDLKKSSDADFIINDLSQLVADANEGTRRVAEIVNNLRTFARVDEPVMQDANINDCLESTLKVIHNELKYKCTVVKKFGKLPNLKCQPGQLNQVFMNLLVNAAQAMIEMGTITIETESTPKAIYVRISDTGQGIAPENLSKLFNPFFTTKPVGKGTGLGLSVSYGIIQKHGGTIQAASEVGKGTTFSIMLPLTPKEHQNAA